jgi:hypothetical protein
MKNPPLPAAQSLISEIRALARSCPSIPLLVSRTLQKLSSFSSRLQGALRG